MNPTPTAAGNGGSIRVNRCQFCGAPCIESILSLGYLLPAKRQAELSFDAALAEEKRLLTPLVFAEFRRRVSRSKLGLTALLSTIRAGNGRVYGIGAPTRASTLVNHVALDETTVDCVLEINGSYKIGKYMPETLIPVADEALFRSARIRPTLFVAHRRGVDIEIKREGLPGQIHRSSARTPDRQIGARMKLTPFYPRVLASRSVFENRWARLLEKQIELEPEAAPQTFYSLDPPDYICAIAKTYDGRFSLFRQYRPAVETVTWEFSSGTLEPGEEAAACARRELLEETGYVSIGDTLLATLTTDVGRLGNRIFGFHCCGCVPASGCRPEEGIEVRVVTHTELGLLIECGEFSFALHLAMWAAYLRVVEGSGFKIR